jgi:hypothetical protein
MLSTQTRLRLEQIAARIEKGEEVSLEDMIFAEKWSKANQSAAGIIRKARRVAVQGKGEDGSLDEFMQIMDLGNPDPSTHLDSSMSVDDLYNFFKNDDDSMRRD